MDLEMLEKISQLDKELEKKGIQLVHTGGKTLNFFLSTTRHSDDQDFSYSFESETSSRTVFKKILKTIEEIFELKKIYSHISGCEDNPSRECKIENIEKYKKENKPYFLEKGFEKINWDKDPIERKGLQINEVVIPVANSQAIHLDFVHDDTVFSGNFFVEISNIKVARPEYTIAAKTNIIYKRLLDTTKFFNNKMFRHIYDIYRILTEETHSFNNEIYESASKILIENDQNNSNERHKLIPVKGQEIIELLNKNFIDGQGIFYKSLYEAIIVKIEELVNVQLNSEEFIKVINDWLIKQNYKYK